jgi:hypothetical protein
MSRMDLPAFESLRGEFAISTNRDALDLDVIYNFLADSYWAAGIPRDVVTRSIQNSLCFGIYQQQQQVGFARVISDFATYAYIADVFVVDGFRGRGARQVADGVHHGVSTAATSQAMGFGHARCPWSVPAIRVLRSGFARTPHGAIQSECLPSPAG